MNLSITRRKRVVKNLIASFKKEFEKEIQNYGITEIFIVGEELHTTSNYELPFDLITSFEHFALVNGLAL